MKTKRRPMMERIVFLAVLSRLLACQTVVAQEYVQNDVECNEPPDGVRGYDSIEALNTDIQAERARVIADGGQLSEYEFRLCPNTALDGTAEPLRPDLENIVILCEPVEQPCTIFGGENQVEITSFSNTEMPVTRIEFHGVTFASFTGAAVTGDILGNNDETTVTFREVTWRAVEDGNNAQLIVQDNPDATPFNVVIEDSVVRDIQGVSGFVSNGGSIRVANLEVENVQLSGPLFSVNDNGGVLQLRDLNVERGIGGENQMENIVSLQGGAQGNVESSSVTDLTAVESVFKTSGDGTSLNIDGVSVFEINIADADQGWKIFEAEDSSSMQIANSEVRDTSGTINIFDANTSADMTVTGTTVTGVTGGLANTVVSAVGQAASGGSLSISSSLIDEPEEFFSVILVRDPSQGSVDSVCIRNGDGLQGVIFASSDSIRLDSTNNAIVNTDSTLCRSSGVGSTNPTDGRQLQETGDPTCLDGSGNCDYDCTTFAEFDQDCAEIVQATFPPTDSPGVTEEPTTAPSDFPSSVPTTTSGPTATFTPTRFTELPTLAPSLGPSTFEPTPSLIPEDTPTATPSGMPSSLPTIPLTPGPSVTITPTSSTDFPTSAPSSSTDSPTSSTESPTSSTDSPTSSTLSPTSSTNSPTSSTNSPTSSTDSPTSTTNSPTSSTESPTSTTLSPTSSTDSPTSSTQGPSAQPTVTSAPTATTAPTSISEPTSAPSGESPSASPTNCVPRPIFISARNPDRNNGNRRLPYAHSYPSSSSKSYKYKYVKKRPSKKPWDGIDPNLPYCDDVFKPIVLPPAKHHGHRRELLEQRQGGTSQRQRMALRPARTNLL